MKKVQSLILPWITVFILPTINLFVNKNIIILRNFQNLRRRTFLLFWKTWNSTRLQIYYQQITQCTWSGDNKGSVNWYFWEKSNPYSCHFLADFWNKTINLFPFYLPQIKTIKINWVNICWNLIHVESASNQWNF